MNMFPGEVSAEENVLYEFALAKERPDAELLDEFVQRYPEHADALTGFAVSLVLDTGVDEETVTTELPSEARTGVSLAVSRFQNRLFEVKTEARSQEAARGSSHSSLVKPPRRFETGTKAVMGPAPRNPFLVLDRQQIRTLGERLHANTIFMMKLRDREIASETMTIGFLTIVAQELREELEVVTQHFAAPGQLFAVMNFKSESKPQVREKQSFEEAVKNSALTAEQQAWLLSL
jgi:hypothetical protein